MAATIERVFEKFSINLTSVLLSVMKCNIHFVVYCMKHPVQNINTCMTKFFTTLMKVNPKFPRNYASLWAFFLALVAARSN